MPLLSTHSVLINNINDDFDFVNDFDSTGRKQSNAQADFFKDSKVRDEDGNLMPMYHGTSRGDRVTYYFNPEKATSGPMAYFTNDKTIAENYAKDKKDTSFYYLHTYKLI